MKALIASSEVVPFAKTGGLADVAGTLVNELKKAGVDAGIILPFYKSIKQAASDLGIMPLNKEIAVPLGNEIEKGRLWKGRTSEGADAYFIENDKFYDRDGLYGTPEGDYPDNASRFIFYSRGVIEAMKALGLNADIIHCNDWQTGLIPVYLKTIYRDEFPKTATIMTVHNLGYQGIFPRLDMPLTGLGWEMFHMEALEFYGKLNLLKGGLLFADVITTVSKTYAKEIQTPEYGFGLENVLNNRSSDLYGIINGIDYSEWQPWKDKLIPAKYNKKNLSGKAECKKRLQIECGLPEDNSPLIGMVTRLSSQKGLDLVAEAAEGIVESGAQLVILGIGEEHFHEILSRLQAKYSRNISLTIGFDNMLAHKIYAGSDIFLMPSLYEPCGLGQLIALRYGTIPVARRTGGLNDTIAEYDFSLGSGTGFLFDMYSQDQMLSAIKLAVETFKDKKRWEQVQHNAMSQDFSWHKSAKEYIALYKKVLKKRAMETTD
ncbi:MAG: glycogen synthase GlgA [Nitrospirae bacterium]|nr:glycogen synthase GlgA [Nitrospirota bacterium]